jgi:hypothetical protein
MILRICTARTVYTSMSHYHVIEILSWCVDSHLLVQYDYLSDFFGKPHIHISVGNSSGFQCFNLAWPFDCSYISMLGFAEVWKWFNAFKAIPMNLIRACPNTLISVSCLNFLVSKNNYFILWHIMDRDSDRDAFVFSVGTTFYIHGPSLIYRPSISLITVCVVQSHFLKLCVTWGF